MTNQTAQDDTEFRSALDEVAKEYLQLQIICMMLQYEGCNRIRGNDSENGLIILEGVAGMRASMKKQKQTFLDAGGTEGEFEEACERIGFNKNLYTSLTDAVFRDNTLYFYVPKRPDGSEYKCDELAFMTKVYSVAREFFPSLYEQAA